MSLDYEKYSKKQERILSEFSGRFMSNSKWLKLFKILTENRQIVDKCYVIDIYNDKPKVLDVPTYKDFTDSYSDIGIKDGVLIGSPLLFKEIKLLEFPASWSIERKMRNQILEPSIYYQDLDLIQARIVPIGELVIERDENSLKIYGYK
jgi:hypothetical protein